MNRRLSRFLAGAIVLASAPAGAETLSEYVNTCKNELGFTSIDDIDCNQGVRFGFNDSGGLLNDVVGYQRVAPYVDVAFACRWLQPREALHGPQPPFNATTAASLELLVHNRQNGKTCFFAAKSRDPSSPNGVDARIPSPTSANRDAYWISPFELNVAKPTIFANAGDLVCVSCHAAGPYIASPRIASALAQFGLFTNGHDTVADVAVSPRRYQAVNSNVAGSYFATIPLSVTIGGMTFGPRPSWNAIIDAALDTNSCARGCHSIADYSTAPGITGATGQNLIPPISSDIAAVRALPLMPQSGIKLSEDYRWNNVGFPQNPSTGGDVELFYDLKANWVGFTPTLTAALTCETEPAYMEAHVVGKPDIVRSNEATASTTGFPDVLEKFDQTGLVCRNASQSNGLCSNYVVRYVCYPDKVAVYSRWTGRALTIANADANGVRLAKGQPWNASWGTQSQTWHVEGLNDNTVNYRYMRFANPWSSLYLNADNSLSVTNAPKNASWLSEQWVMENINGTKFVRFRNLWKTDMYLTMVDSSDYSDVNLQPLHRDAYGNPDWLSQQWEVKATPSP